MKLVEVPLIATSLFGFCFLAGLDAPTARADFQLGEPANLGPTVNGPAYDGGLISPDGLSIFFDSDRSGGYGDWDIWITTRGATDAGWGIPVNLGSTVNTSAWDGVPSLSADGRTLYFSSNRPGGSGDFDLWVTTRQTTDHPWATPVNVGSIINSPGISAKYVKLTIESNWGGVSPSTGLSEVRFFYIPDRSADNP